jgi:UDP-N-acetylglucosamine--N-acetylmuramyl-(pentapeptide) pyrophosphoryl-undecaprenol N-acetylglucosamine transferase
MEEAGAAVVIRDEALTPEALRAAVDAIALDGERRAAMAAAARARARPDAARVIAAEVLAAAATRR